MKKLSELKNDELVIVEYKGGTTEVIPAEDIHHCIEYNEGYELEFYTAVEDAVCIDVETLIEAFADEQYEDWDQDMYEELKDSPEAKAFVEVFNRAAQERATYHMGHKIDLEG